jgi:hypothetical protein
LLARAPEARPILFVISEGIVPHLLVDCREAENPAVPVGKVGDSGEVCNKVELKRRPGIDISEAIVLPLPFVLFCQ